MKTFRRCVTTAEVGICHKNANLQLIASAYYLYPLEKRGKIVSREQISRRRQHGGKLSSELLKKSLFLC